MKINHIFQPSGSSLCGQTCVAMIAEVSLEESIEAFGGKNGGTRTKDVVTALQKLGIQCDEKLTRFKGILPDVSIVKLHFDDVTGTHWTLWCNGRFYDPSRYGNSSLNTSKTEYPEGVRITSYLPIFMECMQ